MRPLSQPESRLQAVSNKAGGTGSSRNRVGQGGQPGRAEQEAYGRKELGTAGGTLGLDSISDMGTEEPRKDCKVLVILGGQNKEESSKLPKPNSQWDR